MVQGNRDKTVRRFTIPLHTLDGPALDWVNGHILGNGDVGAVVWGTPERLGIGLSKHNVWDLSHPLPHGNRWDTPYSEMRRRILDGRRDLLETVANKGYAHCWQEFQVSCGALHLNLLENQQWVDHRQTLSLEQGECRVEIPMSECGFMWGADYKGVKVTTCVHATRNAVLVKLESEARYTCSWSYTLSPSNRLSPPQFEVLSAVRPIAVMKQVLREEDAYAVALSTSSSHFSAYATPSGLMGQLSFGGEAGSVTLVLAMGSTRDHGCSDYQQKAVSDCLSAVAADEEELQRWHREWWQRFWDKSAIWHPDERINRLWYTGLYALGCSTRPHLSPPHLQGIWNQHVLPAWHTDFHNNLNVQESHWAAISSNHPECQEALIRCLLHDWRDEFRRLAREQFDAPGLAIGLCHDWLGRSLGGWVFDLELCITAWYGQHIWWQFEAEGDLRKLRNQYLPWLREACEFYAHILREDAAGQFNFELSHSPEQFHHAVDGCRVIGIGRNPAIDIVFTELLFRNFVEGCRLVGVMDPFVERCAHIKNHLPALPVQNGVLIDQELIYLAAGDIPGKFPHCDRTPARLASIFPGETLNLDCDPASLELGRRSFQEFLSYGDGDFSGWSYTWQAILAARLGLSWEARERLTILLDHFTLKGGLTAHNKVKRGHDPIFQIEALLGAPRAINEMLMQAVNGTIRLFPALEAGKAAAFRNLRAGGSLLVSSATGGSQVESVTIEALRPALVQLYNPWGASAKVSLLDNDGYHQIVCGNLLQFAAKRGQIIDVTPYSGEFRQNREAL